jgi:hypothetical protein
LRLFVLARLLQVRAIAGTIQCYLALFAATLRANSSVYRGTKAFLLPSFTDGTTQFVVLLFAIMAPRRERCCRRLAIRSRQIAFIASAGATAAVTNCCPLIANCQLLNRSRRRVLGHFGSPDCKKPCENGPFDMLYVRNPRRIRVFSTGG